MDQFIRRYMHIIASHGVRTVENLRIHCGIEDPDELEVCVLSIRYLVKLILDIAGSRTL